MNELSGYVFSSLREGDITLYRGSGNGLTPILLAAAEETSPGSVERLEHEYTLKSELDADWAARPVALARDNGRMTLVLEDSGGTPLDRLLGRPLDVSHFLRIAIPLAGALGHVHERGLIHKDIKPANILVESASGGVWLTGFGIASRLPRERQVPAPPEVIAGTLAYMAPEQTGRMNRSIDSRSDLYALGVTFYQALTGSLPFTATDPMEWVHCHIARKPLPPSERSENIPAPVSEIIMKLLAKTAEDRYQTAVGLAFDLRRCLADSDSFGRVKSFPLGSQDVPDRLLIPEKLYGREREIDALVSAFDRVVAQGTPELVLVSGYSGVGKSSVVNELHKVLVPPRGLFASGKFDQYKRDIPYATLAQAFQKLIRRLLGQSEAELGLWRDALCDALGPNGQLVVNLIPEIELLIGKQPPVPELAPQDAQNRFQMVFRQLIGVFARPEHPLALFLDDLQWLDAATLDLLEHLITHPEVRHLLLVGAYRDNEVAPSHPLVRTLAAIHGAGAPVHEVVLAPLGLHDVSRLVADALHCDLERAQPLARLVHEKTGGNPFFAIQFFTMLADEGLLGFDPIAPAWRWDIDRIRAKGYTENVVEFMVGKLSRLPDETQDALKLLACLGNAAEIATLTTVRGQSEHENPERAMHTALWEAVRAGLVFRVESAYTFPHDRIQQAAYSLIPDAHRADMHLRIGRALLESMTADELDELLFDVANQLNRGAGRLIDRDEKAQVAAIDLRAGRKAKASAACASALAYLSTGMALLDERDWDRQYELTFSLWLERAECELLSGNFENAERLIVELLQRGTSKVDQAAVYRLEVLSHVMKSENQQAVASALTCLRLFGIDLPAHPTQEEVQAEYEAVWETLNGRPIESLIDLPMMTDPELLATMQVLSVLTPSAYFTDFLLYCLQVGRMVRISMQQGMSGPSAHAYGSWGAVLALFFHRYREAHLFARLACDLVEKHGFIAYRAKVHYAMGMVAFWTQPIATAIDFMRAAFRNAIEMADLTFACYGVFQSITGLLLQNDPLDAVWRETEMALDVARQAKYGSATDIIRSQQRFIAAMQGRTASFSTFSDAQFDEAMFEAQLTAGRVTLTICWYWILKLKARFLSGDYAEALAAADRAKALLSAAAAQIKLLDYFYYTALTVAALYENGSADEQTRWRDLLTAHQEQLREWAENYPPTFADKYALVLAEIARIEGRDADAMLLYEQAIRSAREHGFVQNEGLAHEVAARFYTARGFETISHAYLRNARSRYLRWGAVGKARQLDQLYPHLRREEPEPGPTSTIGAPVEHLDLATVIKVSQAVSGEIVLEKLIDKLMRTAIEHAGAERGLLILRRGDEQRIEAEARTGGDAVIVELRYKPISAEQLPEAVLHYVLRTQESVILDDAAEQNPFSADPYIRQRRARSILCMPLLNQAKLIGVLYLENNLMPRVFAPARTVVLKLLASQAAIALENARLYGDVAEREAKIRRLVDANIVGIYIADIEGRIFEANDAFLHIIGFDREDLVSGRLRRTGLTPSEWRERDERALAELYSTGSIQLFEKEYLRKDGSRVPVLVGVALFKEGGDEGVAFVLDLTERKRAEGRLRVQHTVAQILAEVVTIEEATSRILPAMGECLGWDVGAFWRVDQKAEALRCVALWHKASIEVPEFERVSCESTFGPGLGLPGRVWSNLQPEYVYDVVSDENFPRGPIAKREDLHAALAFPILLGGEALGVIEFFSREIRQPDQELLNVLATIGNQIGQFIERKQAEMSLRDSEEALRRSEAWLAQAQRLNRTGTWVMNGTTRRFLYWSDESYRIWGFDPLQGLPSREDMWARIHPDDRERMWEIVQEALRQQRDFSEEFRILLPDGTIKHLEANAYHEFSAQGALHEVVCTNVDVTERKYAQDERERLHLLEADLAHMNRLSMMGELAASLAHEIKQPIAATRMFASAAMGWLDRSPPDLDQVRQAVAPIVNAANRAADIIDRIRDNIKKAPPRKTCFDLNEAINEVIGLARSAITENRVSVRTRAAEGSLAIHGDRVQLQQVLLNLVLNAVEAMGSVEAGARELLISTERDRTGARVAVRDSGPGIDATHLERVFQAFYTTKSSGTGMGLLICRSIVEAHGGKLWAEANQPRGAVFQFTLPAAQEEP